MAIIDRLLGLDKKPLELDDPYEYDKQDCTSCRLFGSTALVCLGGYTYFSGMQQLRLRQNAIQRSKSKYKTGSRQLGIVALSASIFGLGVYRLFN